MATRTLVTAYLSRLTNANHDGVTQQIDDRLQAFETENQMLIQAAATVHAARQNEDAAYRWFSGKDFASDDLKAADQLEDKYMSTIHAILNGLLFSWRCNCIRTSNFRPTTSFSPNSLHSGSLLSSRRRSNFRVDGHLSSRRRSNFRSDNLSSSRRRASMRSEGGL